MADRKPPAISKDTPIGPDVDLDHEDVRLPGGARLTKTMAARIAKEVHQAASQPQPPPPPATVNAVADVLGIDRAEARRLTDIPSGSVSDDELDALEAELGVDLSVFTPDQRRGLLIFARVILEASMGHDRENRRGA
jgi:hypothetical protein